MNKKIRKEVILGLSFLLGCGSLLAQQEAAGGSAGTVASSGEVEPSEAVVAPDIIFSNLGPAAVGRYSTYLNYGLPVTGKGVSGETESWEAVRFTPKVDTQAKILAAAIGYLAGTKQVNLGIYSDDDGTVGALLPGGEGTTNLIPDIGECCQMAKVILPEEGVALTAGTDYWLVASPDNANAPDFEGGWQVSNRGIQAGFTPPLWKVHLSAWPAAQIRGMNAPSSGSSDGPKQKGSVGSSVDASTSKGDVIIYNNVGPSTNRYFNYGPLVTGNAAAFQPEVWEALPFIPKADVHAKTLAAAIGWVSGTKLVNLGIYSDDDGNVGALLPGAQGSTSDIPDADECCKLARVTLPGAGAALTAGRQYWLVASPDNRKAPDFYGRWQDSTQAVMAYQEPEHFIGWISVPSDLLAAEIRGTLP